MLRLLMLFLAPLALAGCNKPLFAPPLKDAHPALWAVKDADTTIYLFGTVHVLRPGLRWFQGPVRQAFDSSGELVLEIADIPRDAMPAIMYRLVIDKGPRLSQRMPAATLDKMGGELSGYGFAPDSLDRFAPWYAAIALSQLATSKTGYSPKIGVEAILSTAAAQQRKPKLGLETFAQQFDYFGSLSPHASEALLARTVDNLPRFSDTIDAVTDAWSKGDADALARLMNADLADSPELTAVLVEARNRRWADWIVDRMRRPGVVFLAVGAGHLAGPASLQGELARRGLTVTRVDR